MDVNFLNNKKDTKNSAQPDKKPKENQEKIEWSKPKEEAATSLADKEQSSRFGKKLPKFSFSPKNEDLAKLDNGIDKNKLEQSRKEILKNIKEDAKALAKIESSSSSRDKSKLADQDSRDNNELSLPADAGRLPAEAPTRGRGMRPGVRDQGGQGIEKNKSSKQEKEINKNPNNIFKKIGRVFSRLFNRWSKKKDKDLLVDYQKALQIERNLKKPAIKIETTSKPESPDKAGQLKIKSEPALVKEIKEDEQPKEKVEPIIKFSETAKESKDKEIEETENKQTAGIEWKAPEVLETNLIKGKAVIFFNWRKNIATLLVSSSIVIAILGISYGGLIWWDKSQIKVSESLTAEINELNQEVKKTEDNLAEILVFKKKLNLVIALLDQHTYWTNFFKFLEENTLSEVYYLNFFGDNQGSYTLAAKAEDYDFIAPQIKRLLAHEKVISASVDEAAFFPSNKEGEPDKINFDLKLTVDPSIFIK